MIQGLIGRKVGMTQIFEDNGSVLPVTVLRGGALRSRPTQDR